jgi:hypothetical protein
MIADKSLLDRKWPADSDRRQRHLYDGYAVQEAGLKRRSTISHPRVEPHDLASFGAASVYVASVKGSWWRRGLPGIVLPPAPHTAPRLILGLRSPLLAVCQVMVTSSLARIESCRRSTR